MKPDTVLNFNLRRPRGSQILGQSQCLFVIINNSFHSQKSTTKALAGVAQWMEWIHPKPVQFPGRSHARVAGHIPTSGHASGNHTDVSLPLFLPPFPSLKINK